MPKKYDDKLRYQIKREYCLYSKPIDELAKQFGISKQTLLRWREAEDWDKLNHMKNASLFRVEQHAVAQMNKIMQQAEKEDRVVTPAETDQLAKLRKLIDSLSSDVAFITNAIDAISQFMQFVREQDPDLHEQLTELAIEFTQNLANSTKRPF